MKKSTRAGLSIGLALSALAFVSVASTYAAGNSNCQVIYGGGEVCTTDFKFSIDKTVQQPNKGGSFVDNIAMDAMRFNAGSNVTFKIKVTNTGNSEISTLTVTDTLPEHVSVSKAPGNANGRNITYTVNNLKAGESREELVVVTVNNDINTDKNVSCLTNEVTARDNNGNTANDKASFCLEKEVTAKPTPQVFEKTPVKKIPETGPEMLSLLGLLPLGAAGIAMRRKSKLG